MGKGKGIDDGFKYAGKKESNYSPENAKVDKGLGRGTHHDGRVSTQDPLKAAKTGGKSQ